MAKLSSLRISLAISFCIINLTLQAQKRIVTDTAHYQTLRMDPSNANGGNASDIFDKIEYIPLETTTESTFGSVRQLEIVDDYFIILDHNTNCILIFDRRGKYLSKIKGKKDNPNYKIWDFTINRWTKEIIFSEDGAQTMNYYSLDGKLKKSEKTPNNNPADFLTSRFYFVDRDLAISYYGYHVTDTSSNQYTPFSRALLVYLSPLKRVGMMALNYTAQESRFDYSYTGIGPITKAESDTTFFLSKPYAGGIYKISPNQVSLSYKIIFPQQVSLPGDFLSNTSYDYKRSEYPRNNRRAIYSINNFYKSGDNLLFEASSYEINREDNLIYNLKTANLIAYKHIATDNLSYQLPLYDSNSAYFDIVGILGSSEGNIYTSLSSLAMFDAYQANKNKSPQYHPRLTEYFKTSGPKSNPVLLQLKLKDKL